MSVLHLELYNNPAVLIYQSAQVVPGHDVAVGKGANLFPFLTHIISGNIMFRMPDSAAYNHVYTSNKYNSKRIDNTFDRHLVHR